MVEGVEPVDVEDAEEDTERKLGVFPNPSLDECPVVFLGFEKGKVVFALPEGEIRDEPAKIIGQLLKVDIFNSMAGQAFLTHWRDSADKFQRDLCAIWFVRQCRDAGRWDSSRPMRGLGVWRGEGGQVVLHRGAELWEYADGEVDVVTIADAMRRRAGPIWRLSAPTPKPAAKPSSAGDGAWIRAQLDRWRFEALGADGLTGADVVAGWLMCAMLGAAAPFRPHVLLYALAGSGKTTLMRFLQALQSALAVPLMDSFTEAGLRQELAGNARGVLIDEAEASPSTLGPGPIEKAMDLLRRMATGDGAVRKQGDTSGGGTVQTSTALGAVLMAAVNLPKLQPADASRISEVRLLPLSAPAPPGLSVQSSTDADLEAARSQALALAPALLARALIGADRYVEDVAVLKRALLASGLAPRAADLVAALAAGRRLLLSDDPLDEATAADEATQWRGLIDVRAQGESQANPGADALAHMFTWRSGVHRNDRELTVGELVQRWWRNRDDGHEDTGPFEDQLKAIGLLVKQVPGENDNGWVPLLIVANNHAGLERIFERTPWRDWRRTLAHLDALGEEFATRATERPMRFGVGVQQRGIVIPLAPWLGSSHWRTAPRTGQEHDP